MNWCVSFVHTRRMKSNIPLKTFDKNMYASAASTSIIDCDSTLRKFFAATASIYFLIKRVLEVPQMCIFSMNKKEEIFCQLKLSVKPKFTAEGRYER